MGTDNMIDWDYYYIYLMIIHELYEMLSLFFCDKGRVPSQIVVFFMYSINTKQFPTCKQPYSETCLQ